MEVSLADVEAAARRLEGKVLRTPTVVLNCDVDLPDTKVYLKLENLQPIGSFKLRGACNAIDQLSESDLAEGVLTASAGNFAQGLAWNTGKRGITCNVIVPDHAPATKIRAIEKLGGIITRVPFDTWWKVIQEKRLDGIQGHFIHPVADTGVISGNGTVGLEILQDVSDVDAVLVPYGGGGLSAGIACAVKARSPSTKVFACEVETAAPLKASLDAGRVTECDFNPSFVDGIGSKSVLPDMWPLVSKMIDDSLVVSLQQVANAIRLLAERNCVIAEGAGAATVAAALAGLAGNGNLVCVISGGNLDTKDLIQVLEGKVPSR